ncbi:DUF1775 domain-containing protein [Streptomyces sp. P9(2023)]|uniref:DUF1775 domain-containing protein n=1 Tax=Streptomyces sp. P9(2023) TaxID=3064394 RepID=UPI0028F451E0|nr:DUF1775 domain-containing protein [Streptomyces sp. P9(2023)]MDT9687409.1 DUF1775 domain-containing protein [Streptomyces sp. P9(2023)]
MTRSRTSSRTARVTAALAASAAFVVAGSATAFAHTEVDASDDRALAENVTLTFSSEAESDSAGIKQLRIVLPEGLAPEAVVLKAAPKGWTLAATPDGYTVGGTPLKAGVDAEHSVVVRQLPEAASLAFKTVETYEDGKISRWIEVPANGQKVENPAPVLKLKPAAPGAKPLAPSPSPTPTPTPEQTSQAPATSAAPSTSTAPSAQNKDDEGGNLGVIIGVAAVVLVGAGAALWFKRRGGSAG